jgi:hypothetical protein
LRGAGFPAAHARALGAPAAARAVDALAADAEQLHAARDLAIAVLERAGRSKPVNRAVKALRRGESPTRPDPPPDPAWAEGGEIATALDVVATAEARHAAMRHAAELAIEEAAREVAVQLQERASDPRFREALLWQNRVAVHGSVAALLRRPADAIDSKTREQRRLVASYLQRYCVKNDTIGFFGPVGWATLSDHPDPIVVRPGPDLLASRTVYFEYWPIDAVAAMFASDPELRSYAVPRRMPSVRVDGHVLHHPNGKRFELSPDVAGLLAAIDGVRSANQIAADLVAEAALGFGDEADVLELLAELADKKLCIWTFEIPTATFRPERHLRDALSAMPRSTRERALATLDELEARRDAVARAAGDPEALDRSLQELEATFATLTSRSATRKGGETYAGRTVVYEDCRRDLDVELGRGILDRLAAPLALVLESARWYTHEIAVRYERALRGVCQELRKEHGGEHVELVRLEDRLPSLFPGPASDVGIVADVLEELHRRWEAVLAIDDEALDRTVSRRSTELHARVRAAFEAPGPGWPNARHHSPDILVAARSVDAIRRGELQLVLGEIHVGFNTIMPCLQKEHPDPAVLVQAREADLPDPLVELVWSKQRNRADFFSVSSRDLDLERGETRSARPRDQILTTAELVIEQDARGLWVRTRDGSRRISIIAFLERHLIAESYGRFRLLRSRPRLPRVAIDDLVVQRETWSFACDELAFAGETTELARFAAARRFAQHHAMPGMVFAKTDAEAKPFLVDFSSPLLVEIFARNIKRARHVVLSEMLPTLDDCWLPDASDQRYTSELRLVAVDAIAWRPEPLS